MYLKIFDVAALVAGDGDALHVFGQGRGDDVVDRAVVAEVDDFDAVRLQDAAHDVNRGIVAVEQRRGGDEADLVGELRLLRQLELGGGGDVVHGVPSGSRTRTGSICTVYDVNVNVKFGMADDLDE
jgi:hypothetical protein